MNIQDLQEGDRITYKYNNGDDKIYKSIIQDDGDLEDYKERIERKSLEILKIERPKYEVVEENEELLTEEEKEFLKGMCKYYDITKIKFYDIDVRLFDKDNRIKNCPDYPPNMKFQNVKKTNYYYNLKELGLEE